MPSNEGAAGGAAPEQAPQQGRFWSWLTRLVTRPHAAVVLFVENVAYSIYCMVRDVATVVGFPPRVVRGGVRRATDGSNVRRVRRKRLHFVTKPSAEVGSLAPEVVRAAAPTPPPVEDTEEMGSETEGLSDLEVDVEIHSTTAAGASGIPALPGVEPGATAADLADDVVVAVGGDGSFHNVLNATIQQLGAAESREEMGEDGGEEGDGRPSMPQIPVAFGIVPRGSDNGAANSLGLTDEKKALSKLAGSEPPRALDVMELVMNGNTASPIFDVHAICWGGGAEMNKMAEGPYRWMGNFKKVAAPVAALWDNKVVEGRVKITLDGDVTELEGPFATVIVINLALGSDVLTIAKDAKPDDGVMHVVVAQPGTRLDYVAVFWGMLRGTLASNEKVTIYKADRVVLDTETGALDVSGEAIARLVPDADGTKQNTKVDITLHPSCIEAFF